MANQKMENNKAMVNAVCEKFNLQVVGNFEEDSDTLLVIFKKRGTSMLVPFYFQNGEIMTRTENGFLEVTAYEVGDWF